MRSALAVLLLAACAEPKPPQPPTLDVAASDAGVAAPDAASPTPTASATAEPPVEKIVSVRQGTTQVRGKLPPDEVLLIVRQRFGRFRLCYERGLEANPALGGSVTTEFVIDRAGDVATVRDRGSDLPDPNVVTCVVEAFKRLEFRPPESGNVTVVYTVIFAAK